MAHENTPVRHEINLFDPALRPSVPVLPARQFGVALGGVLLLLVAVAVWLRMEASTAAAANLEAEARIRTLEMQIKKLGEAVAVRKPSPELEARIADREALRGTRSEALARIRADSGTGPGGHARFLKALARQAVPGVWLTGVTLGSGGHDIEIRGRALAPELVSDYLRNLGREEAFRGQAFNRLEFEQPKAGAPVAGSATAARYVEFTVATSAAGTPGAQP
jgi:MSHA biogenesis protein MshI